MVNIFFDWCVLILDVIGNFTGLGYKNCKYFNLFNNLNLSNSNFLFNLKIQKKKK